jgi:hypothetical protein
MDKENNIFFMVMCVCVYHGILLSHKEKWNYVIFRKMDGTEDHHIE